MRRSFAPACLLFALALPACSSSQSDGAPSPTPTRVLFSLDRVGGPAYGDVPFPSDFYRAGSLSEGTLPAVIGPIAGFDRVMTKSIDVLAKGIAALDGFSRTAAAQVFTSGPVDPASLPGDAASSLAKDGTVFYVDVDPSSPDHGKRLPAVARFLPSISCISVLPFPGTVLAPGVRYALVVTTGALAADGSALAVREELASGEGDGQDGAALAAFRSAIDDLVATGQVASRDAIAGVTVFTTSKAVLELPALRDRLRAAGAFPAPQLLLDPKTTGPFGVATFAASGTPSLDDWLGHPDKDENGHDWPGADNKGGIAHDAIAAVASGAFVAPSFLDPATHHFEKDDAGAFRVGDPGALVPVTIVVPTAAMPGTGYPVVVAAHGLGGSRASIFAWANMCLRACPA